MKSEGSGGEFSLTLRRATIDDMKMIFDWRNLPELFVWGKTRKPVEWEEHVNWFKSVITSPQHFLLIVAAGDKPIGQVRFDRKSNHVSEVSIYLLPHYTGRGLGVKALRLACDEAFARMSLKEILALIREDNHYSISAFTKAGFARQKSEKPGYVSMHLERSR